MGLRTEYVQLGPQLAEPLFLLVTVWVSATAMAPSKCEQVGVGEEVLLRSQQRERFVSSFVCLICLLCRPGWLSASILHPSWTSLDLQETNFLRGLVAFEVKIPCCLLKHFLFLQIYCFLLLFCFFVFLKSLGSVFFPDNETIYIYMQK